MQAAAQNTDDAFSREIGRVIDREIDADRLKALLGEPGSFDRALWDIAKEQGWCALALPEACGGLGLGWRELADALQVLGRVTVSLPLTQATVTARLLLTADNATEFEAVCADIAAGNLIPAIALMESGDAGLPAIPSLSFRDGVINGSVAQTAFAAVADIAVLRVATDTGCALALVSLKDNGVTRSTINLVDNARGAAALRFSDSAATLIVIGADDGAMNAVLAPFVVMTAFEQIGGAADCLEIGKQFAMEHRAFGQPIGAFQAIKHKMADIYTAIEIAKGCALEALEELDAGSLSMQAAAAARIAANRAYDFAAQECIQIHGGMGVTWEAFVHHHYRRARSLALETGSTAFWREQLLEALFAARSVGGEQR